MREVSEVLHLAQRRLTATDSGNTTQFATRRLELRNVGQRGAVAPSSAAQTRPKRSTAWCRVRAPSPGPASGRQAADGPSRHRSTRSASRGTGRRSRRLRPSPATAPSRGECRGRAERCASRRSRARRARLTEQLDRERASETSSSPPRMTAGAKRRMVAARRGRLGRAAVRPLPRRGKRSGAPGTSSSSPTSWASSRNVSRPARSRGPKR